MEIVVDTCRGCLINSRLFSRLFSVSKADPNKQTNKMLLKHEVPPFNIGTPCIIELSGSGTVTWCDACRPDDVTMYVCLEVCK
jgi:hypothetical protein